ncbi:MAG: restriction endonuclease subunit S [Flavobacteriales bacterium]|nr:restriction endonuclease subunit S [Flavobacteriales bacterium]
MNAELLLKHFHQLGDAPDAVPRLRRFILDLAVRGKLVEQNPKDEPAAELLKRIEKDTTSRLVSGDFSEPKNAIEFPWNELPFSVPEHWKWARLIEFAEVSYGFAFDSNKFNNAQRGMPLIRIRDISKADTEAYTEEAYDRYYLVNHGDMLIGMDGDFNVRKWKGKEALLNQRLCRIKGWRHGINPDFIVIPLQMILDHLHSSTSLTTVKHLSAKQMNGVYLPLPPLPEQHRIVAKVEELMTLCDQLEAAQQQREEQRTRLTAATWQAVVDAPDAAPARSETCRTALQQLPALTTRPGQVKALRQTILDLAVRGKLVEQNPKDEPAEVLLERIRKEKERLVASGELRKKQELKDHVDHELLWELPASWVWCGMDETYEITSGIQKTGARTPKDNSFPYLGVGNVYRGRLDLSSVKRFELFAGELEKYRLMRGDILLVEGNGSASEVGRCALWNGEIKDCVHQNHIIRCRAIEHGITPYVMTYLNSPLGVENMTELAVTSSGLYNLSVGKIRTIMVPLPPLPEQHRIVAKVEELMALCDQLEATLAEGEMVKAKALEALIRSDDEMIRRSDNGLPAVPAPKAVMRTPRYAEAAVELAVAAEPAPVYGKPQSASPVVATPRRRGRPRKAEAPQTDAAAGAILAFLKAHPGLHGKAAILAATGIDAAAWNAAIKALLEAGSVVREGEKKGARYRAR